VVFPARAPAVTRPVAAITVWKRHCRPRYCCGAAGANSPLTRRAREDRSPEPDWPLCHPGQPDPPDDGDHG
jgi:hypothetical protein